MGEVILEHSREGRAWMVFDLVLLLYYQRTMRREQFEAIATKAIAELPSEFLKKLQNIDVVVEDWPAPTQLARAGLRTRLQLLGLYQGVPHTRRGENYGLVPPDKITLFRKPIEARCRSQQGIEAEIRRVLRHEIAHHFGMSDAALRALEGEE